MKFYNREKELKILNKIEESSEASSKLTFIVGRRRIGKTRLIKKAYQQKGLIYLFVSKKEESLLCSEFCEIIKIESDIKILGEFSKFKDLFEYLMEISKTRKITLAIDEFQEFNNINSSIYSDIQNIWDSNKEDSQMNLVLSGSIYSLMHKIFENNKEPLFGRADRKINLKSFSVSTVEEILRDYYPTYTEEDLLAFWTITGGVAKYVEILINEECYTRDQILDYIYSHNSLFLNEGKTILIEEFGKEYKIYFSILSLISCSKTSRSEMESILGKNIGGYLKRLEEDYSIIKRVKPMFAKPNGKVQKFMINDNFLNFWFRYIYKWNSIIELENFEAIKEYVKKDWNVFIGRVLEKYFIEKLTITNEFTAIGNYWEKGNLNEIDIIAINEFAKEVLIIEVKLNPKKIRINNLKRKAEKISKKLKEYNITYKGLSLEDIKSLGLFNAKLY